MTDYKTILEVKARIRKNLVLFLLILLIPLTIGGAINSVFFPYYHQHLVDRGWITTTVNIRSSYQTRFTAENGRSYTITLKYMKNNNRLREIIYNPNNPLDFIDATRQLDYDGFSSGINAVNTTILSGMLIYLLAVRRTKYGIGKTAAALGKDGLLDRGKYYRLWMVMLFLPILGMITGFMLNLVNDRVDLTLAVYNIVLALPLTMMGAMAGLYYGCYILRRFYLYNLGEIASGTVTTTMQHNGKYPYWTVSYRFKPQGTLYTGTDKIKQSAISIDTGDTVSIFYDPENPARNMLFIPQYHQRSYDRFSIRNDGPRV